MVPGDEIAGRFVIDAVANAGSITTLYRAHDRNTGDIVALKVMGGLHGSDLVRFSREARVLAEQHHPGIVRYIAHGVTPQGSPWLAMEWLDGETLGARLDRGPISFEDTVLIGLHVAAALSELHRLGVVHRDIKPCNLFLPDGDVARVKVLDLGIARVPTLSRRSTTRVGTILGTPGYMAPEQVRGAAEIDARADVFALGCVLFECLTGRPAIDGDTVESLLGRTLVEDCPRLATVIPDVHPGFDDLVARMVARDPADRPNDGAAVVRALEPFATFLGGRNARPGKLALAASAAMAVVADPSLTVPSLGPVLDTVPGARGDTMEEEAPTTPPTPAVECIGNEERRLLSVVLVAAEQLSDEAFGPLRTAAEAWGAQFELLWRGMAMVVVRATGAATDQVARAARCALALRALAPSATLALATGWAQESGHGAIGEVIDRASELLYLAHQVPLEPRNALRPVRIGEIDAGLLDARFEVCAADAGYDLVGERVVQEMPRLLLGQPTPFVGRRREMATLLATLDESVEEPVARAVLLTGAAGTGKSRIGHEFERAARERVRGLEVWRLCGDPDRVGAPFALLSGLLRVLAGFAPSDRITVRRQKLRARVGRTVAPADRQRVTDFLGELVDTGFPDADNARLRLARVDAAVMDAEVRRAWIDLVASECALHPLLIVVEDLQWGDAASVRLLDAALRALVERPLMVLGVGRPELHEVLPRLWVERGVQEVRVGALTRRSVEALARHCLGDRLDAPTLARLIERSDGNAFYLEELIRSVAVGRGLSLPGTVQAMVHARLGALDPAARRVLRAASIFGERFTRGGVSALLGEETAGRTAEWLAMLDEQELIVAVSDEGFTGDQGYAFPNPQVRDVAYGMLTDADRILGHRLAAAWLERLGEADPAVVAEHLERGGALARAVDKYVVAARRALDAGELGSVLARAERGLACGASGATQATLLCLQAEAHRWRGDNADAVRCSAEAARLLPQRSAAWFVALRESVIACGRLGDREALTALCSPLCAPAPSPEAQAAHASAQAAAVVACLDAHEVKLAHEVYALLPEGAPGDPSDLRGELLRARAAMTRADGDLERSLTLFDEAARCFEVSGNVREMCGLRVSVGRGRQLLGMYERSLGALREARAASRRLGLHHVAAWADVYLAMAYFTADVLDEARDTCDRALEALARQGNRRLTGLARVVRCRVATALLDLGRSSLEGERAVQFLASNPADQALAFAALAEASLALRDTARALDFSERAVACLGAAEVQCHEEAQVHLVYIDALTMADRHDAAQAAVKLAHRRLMARAAKIHTPALREGYLTGVRDHARVLALFQQTGEVVEGMRC